MPKDGNPESGEAGRMHRATQSAEMETNSTLSAAPIKPNCYECKFRRELPGNAHSRCAHPAIKPDATNELFAALKY